MNIPRSHPSNRRFFGVGRLVAAGLALALVAAACSSGDDGASAPTTEALPDGVVATADGGTIELASLAGQDVLLWFWAPW